MLAVSALIFSPTGEASIVIRYINSVIPRFEEMNLPAVLGEIIMEKRGLVWWLVQRVQVNQRR